MACPWGDLELEGPGIRSSKSHVRREKRKAKEQLYGGSLNDIQAILATMAASTQSDEKAMKKESLDSIETGQHGGGSHSKAQQRSGRIGEGKTEPLSKNQRKRILSVSSHRFPCLYTMF